MTRNELKASLPVGMVATHVDGEYRVTFKLETLICDGVCMNFTRAKHIAEMWAYYTDSPEDALGTAVAMHKEYENTTRH